MKIAYKEKGQPEVKYITPDQITVDGQSLKEITDRIRLLELAYERLIEKLIKDTTITQKGDTVEINGKLTQVESLTVFKKRPDKPLKFYKLENGKLVLDREKVGVIL